MASGYFLCEISGFFKDKYNEDIEQYGVVMVDEQDHLSDKDDANSAVTTIIKKS